jgi:hypothetical protein
LYFSFGVHNYDTQLGTTGNMIVESLGWHAPICVDMSPVATSQHGCLHPTSLSAITMQAEVNGAILSLHTQHKKAAPIVVFSVVCVATPMALPQPSREGG